MAEPVATTPSIASDVGTPADLNLGGVDGPWRFDFMWPTIPDYRNSGYVIVGDTSPGQQYHGDRDSMDLQIVNKNTLIVCNDYSYKFRWAAYLANKSALDFEAARAINPFIKQTDYEAIISPPFKANYNAHITGMQISNFSITSSNDTNYASPLFPTSVHLFTNKRGDGHMYHYGQRRANCWLALMGNWSYLTLPFSMVTGKSYTITQPDGRTATFVFHEDYSISRAIKVNQNGYSPAGTKRYAYLGLWMGGAGPIDFRDWENTTFSVVNANTRAVLTTGTIKLALNGNDPRGAFSNFTRPQYGEVVYEMDLSGITTPGEYYIKIPGVGRSWPFYYHDEAAGRGFYMHMRGLWQQRAGHVKDALYTGWPQPLAHFAVHKGPDFAGESRWDGGDNAFTILRAWELTNTPVPYAAPGMSSAQTAAGGWYDAADYDRRFFHYDVIHDLFLAYESNPAKFLDGQNNTAEAGDGLPDIINEIMWGLQVWKNTQDQVTGGVSNHIESPGNPDPRNAFPNGRPPNDPNHFYLSTPQRNSSFAFAGSAAHLARLLRDFPGKQALADSWMDAALRAYAFGANAANHYTRTNYGGVTGVNYTEAIEMVNIEYFAAAVQLYKATRDPAYLATADGLWSSISGVINAWPIAYTHHNFWYSFYGLRDKTYNQPRVYSIRDGYVLMANQRYDAIVSKSWGYRTTLVPPLPFGTSWGEAHPTWDGRYIAMAYLLRRDPKYIDAISLIMDWMHGCNPLGISWTTGVGYNYPWCFFNGEAEEDDIDDPPPGVTPYGPTGGTPFDARARGMNFATRAGNGVWTLDKRLLPDAVLVEPLNGSMTLLPYWRAWFNGFHDDAGIQEYTIQETISPPIVCYALLLQPGWMPGTRLKANAPRPTSKICGLWLTP